MEDLNEIDELLDGITPEEKLQSAKEIILSLEKETSRLRAELKRSENTIKKLQESASLNGQNQNNTSSAFLLPSEFKKSWEILTMENLLDLLAPFLQNQSEFALLAQKLIKHILNLVTEEITEKVESVCKLLGSPENAKEKIAKSLIKLFQDHCISAFPCPSQRKVGLTFLSCLPRNLYIRVKPLTETTEFERFLKNMHNLAVHMLLNDPPLEISFPANIECVTISKHDDYSYIDGFPVGNPEALIVVPGVRRNTHAYAGIKPSVLIVNSKCVDQGTDEINQKKSLSEARSIEPFIKAQIYFDETKVNEDSEAYPPLQRKKDELQKKECILCKIKAPCAYCSKNTLLALAKRVPANNTGYSYRSISRNQSNSLFENPRKSIGGDTKSILSRRLSEAARKIDRTTLIKKRPIDKEACKVM